ncbi:MULTISPECIES: DUF4124 domain-containing protein [Luteibacter]|uniref:DUF4124 domain-containing protein n=1 Tax=Luteibacter TaxID=242605 RepID=UPI000567F1CF|nr:MULTISPECIES: DUF4124 domain-containing protein [unclassified Luteibacter]MDR6643915.1 hypothetical protein [Luteibacter sp. 1214]
MSMRLMPATIVLALLLTSAAATAQSVYKWTDAQGAVHYADQPPSAGATASTIRVKADARAPVASPVAMKDGDAPSSGALAQAEAEARKRNCERARANLATLSSGALLVDGNDPASAKRLDAGQREAATRTAQTDIGNYCDGGGR